MIWCGFSFHLGRIWNLKKILIRFLVIIKFINKIWIFNGFSVSISFEFFALVMWKPGQKYDYDLQLRILYRKKISLTKRIFWCLGVDGINLYDENIFIQLTRSRAGFLLCVFTQFWLKFCQKKLSDTYLTIFVWLW